MKHIKLFTLALMVASSFLWLQSCEPEIGEKPEFTPISGSVLERYLVSEQYLEFHKPAMLKKLRNIGEFNTSTGKGTYSEAYEFEYDLDQVQIIETEHYTQYAIQVTGAATDATHFENYIFMEYADGTELQALLVFEKTLLANNEYEINHQNTTFTLLQGEALLGRCVDGYELVDVDITTGCVMLPCTGTKHHGPGAGAECTCEITSPCLRAREVCGTATIQQWQLCGGSDTGNPNDNPNTGTAGGGNTSGDNTNDSTDEESELIILPLEELNRRRECRKINSLLEENPQYKTQLIQLASQATTATFEKGIAIDVNGNEIQIPDGVGGKLDPPLNPAEKYLSIAHIHDAQGDQGNGTFSVPSLNDLANLGHISGINDKVRLSKLVYFVFTADGTYYALTINSPSKFSEFWAYQKFFMDYASLTQEQRDEYKETLKKRAQQNNNGIYHRYYNNKNGSLIDETSLNNEQQLKYFLQFLEEEDGMGVSVFETDAQLSQFKEVTLNGGNFNGTLERNDCE